MNLRTFLPPLPLPTAAPPDPGEPARELPDPGLPDGRPAVVAFLRHTGCPFAEATARALREAAGAEPDVAWIAVSHAGTQATARWRDAIGGMRGVSVLVDPDRVHYATWGLGRTSIGHFMGRRSLGDVAHLAREGIRNRHPAGTRWQGAGTFAVDEDGVVRWRHLPEYAGDLPDLAEALRGLGV
ncbi:MAG TPA: AhpC/TSA family protein [Thermoleophilaceae bacterium]|nr:AhpC/TSA family protein [Thermoleophilaceae bacterium]